MKKQNIANLFGNNPDISMDERLRVINEIDKIGGLTFTISKDEEGWMAQCNEVKGIIASNTNPTPSNDEIESQIRDAIFSAFNVRFEKALNLVRPSFGFEYSFSS
ncbi:MAG: hypothetical protein WCX27_03210 [Candidatus Paceibacterota bacterium]|jgi:hypothetical protein